MSDLSISELRRLDLTLLLIFLGLVRTRKASAVATELGLTQSAISQALRRLRDIFGEELFLRRPHGLEPTATALALEAPVSAAVESLRGALGVVRKFDPASAEGVLRIAALDAQQAVLIPALAARLATRAPGLRLSVAPLARSAAIAALEEARVDLAIGLRPTASDTIRSEPLYRDGYRVAGLPASLPQAPKISLKAYTEADHILVSIGGDGRGIVDPVLEARGQSRRITLVLSAFLPALAAAASTGAIVTLPAQVAETFAAGFGLVTALPPVPIREIAVSAIWHRRNDGDPRTSWALEQLRAVASELPASP
ncbi:LysR family transcriptional regulator [Rhodobacterales bacterium HKCCE3408]|nr:LysR family transcriptional regulator [Rhodobacterales bacterium HKCCE3408]